MEKLKFEDLHIGMQVQDGDKNVGVIIECNDIHNIHVKFDNGGSGLYCIDENCMYDPLYRPFV